MATLHCALCGVTSTSASEHEKHLASRRHKLHTQFAGKVLTKDESRAEALQQEPTEEDLADAAGIDLASLRTVGTISYDPARFQLREAVIACLDLAGGDGEQSDHDG